MSEFDKYFSQVWEESKSPLHKIYDSVMPDWEDKVNWVPEGKIRINHDGIKIKLRETGLPIRCHLCGSFDGWKMENEEPYAVPVLTCSHGLAGGVIRKVSSIPAWRVYPF